MPSSAPLAPTTPSSAVSPTASVARNASEARIRLGVVGVMLLVGLVIVFSLNKPTLGYYTFFIAPIVLIGIAVAGGRLAELTLEIVARMLRIVVPLDIGLEATDLDYLKREREVLIERVVERAEDERDDKSANVLDNIRINLNQLAEYYTINKGQARNSFRLSVVTTLLGLITILVGVWLFYFNRDATLAATITTIAGAIGEFIGAASFYLFNKATAQLNIFYSTLVRSQETMLAVVIAEQLDDKAAQEARTMIIRSLLTRSTPSVVGTETKIVRRRKAMSADEPPSDDATV